MPARFVREWPGFWAAKCAARIAGQRATDPPLAGSAGWFNPAGSTRLVQPGWFNPAGSTRLFDERTKHSIRMFWVVSIQKVAGVGNELQLRHQGREEPEKAASNRLWHHHVVGSAKNQCGTKNRGGVAAGLQALDRRLELRADLTATISSIWWRTRWVITCCAIRYRNL